MIQVFPIYGCNFRCKYCIHSVNNEKRRFVSNVKIMNFTLYEKCIHDIQKFPQKIKMLRFAATGEPLLHPKLPEMISFAKQMNIADSIDVVTNGSLLTNELSNKLIESGLDWLRISIQGVSSEKYKDICDVDLHFELLVSNITYFFQHKTGTKVYIKIIDIDLSESEKKRFYDIFKPISDNIAIEYLVPATEHIDYSHITDKKLLCSQNGNQVMNAKVCPQPFFMMQINPDGNAVPCCSMETAFVMGNCLENSLLDIWHSNKLKKFQCQLLKNKKHLNVVCDGCEAYKYNMFEEDLLDDKAEELLTKLGGI